MPNRAGIALAWALASGCAAVRPTPSYVAIYRWQVKAGCEAAFLDAWQAEAERYRDRYGSLGSRMHRDPHGLFVATAFWTSAEAWAAAPRPLDLPAAEATLNGCIESRGEDQYLTVVRDVAPR